MLSLRDIINFLVIFGGLISIVHALCRIGKNFDRINNLGQIERLQWDVFFYQQRCEVDPDISR